MSKPSLVFGPLKNVTNSKVPLVYKSKPSEILLRKGVVLPQVEDVVHPFFKLSNLDIATAALDSNTAVLNGLRVPIRTRYISSEDHREHLLFKMHPLVFPKHVNIFKWLKQVDQSSITIHDLNTFEPLKDTPNIMRVPLKEDKKQLVDNFFANLKNDPDQTCQQLVDFVDNTLQLKSMNTGFEYVFIYLIQQAPDDPQILRTLAVYTKALLAQEEEVGNSISPYFASIFSNAIVTKIHTSGLPPAELKDATIAIEELFEKINNSFSHGLLLIFDNPLLHTLFGYYTQIGNLAKSRKVLLLLLQKKALPSESKLLAFVKKAYNTPVPYKYINDLKSLLQHFNSSRLIHLLVSDCKHISELHLLMNFIDQSTSRDIIYKESAADLIATAIKILKNAKTGYRSKERTGYMKDILVRLTNRNVVLTDDLRKDLVSFFISRRDYREAYYYLNGITDINREYFNQLIIKLAGIKTALHTDHKSQLLDYLIKKVSPNNTLNYTEALKII